MLFPSFWANSPYSEGNTPILGLLCLIPRVNAQIPSEYPYNTSMLIDNISSILYVLICLIATSVITLLERYILAIFSTDQDLTDDYSDSYNLFSMVPNFYETDKFLFHKPDHSSSHDIHHTAEPNTPGILIRY